MELDLAAVDAEFAELTEAIDLAAVDAEFAELTEAIHLAAVDAEFAAKGIRTRPERRGRPGKRLDCRNELGGVVSCQVARSKES
ncbi:MAG: hypothetical protein IPM54_14435 [Polyangiaceae bacterium]|nr:hypothetical protein [Polyangiaceae bacterium]